MDAEQVADMAPTCAPVFDALAGVQRALDTAVELRTVLQLLVEASLVVSGADRGGIFLLRDQRWLEPTVAVVKHRDHARSAKFRALAPVEVPSDPAWREKLLAGRAIAGRDGAAGDLIPPRFVDAFGLQSTVVVPLLAERELYGVLAVDYRDRYVRSSDELAGLEFIASYAGLVVRNAELHDERRRLARINECLVEGVAALASSHDVDGVLQSLSASCMKMLDADSCELALLDFDAARIALPGPAGRTGPKPKTVIPAGDRDRLRARWRVAADPQVFQRSPWLERLTRSREPKLSTHVLIPVPAHDEITTVVCAGFRRTRQLTADEDATVRQLAATASAALERSRRIAELREQVSQLDLLHRLGDAIGHARQPTVLCRRLNRLLQPTGLRVQAVEVTDGNITRHLAWPDDAPQPAQDGRRQHRSVPLRTGRRTIGSLHVSTTDRISDRLLHAVAAGVSDSLVTGASRRALRESARDRALAAEGKQITLELHETVGQAFVTTMLLARRAAEELPQDSVWAERFERIAAVGSEGKWALDLSILALTSVPDARTGLPAALRGFARSVANHSDLSVPFAVRGRVRRLPIAVERALYRVGHQAMSNAWRHAHASAVAVSLDYAEHDVSLTVCDNGIGLSLRPDATMSGVGFTSMRRALIPIQGHLSVANAEPTGLVVRASVPK